MKEAEDAIRDFKKGLLIRLAGLGVFFFCLGFYAAMEFCKAGLW